MSETKESKSMAWQRDGQDIASSPLLYLIAKTESISRPNRREE
jgi:hypothetical protein